MPEPSATTPEPALCESAASLTITAIVQSTIDELAGCETMSSLEILEPLDLRPLAALRRVGGLFLRDVAALDGLENLEEANSLVLIGATIRSVQPLSGLRYVDNLQVGDTGLIDLTGLENVKGLTSVLIHNNLELDSLSGLILEGPANYVTIIDNPVLRSISSLEPLREVWNLEIANNPQLTELPFFSQLAFMQSFLLTNNASVRALPDLPAITGLVTLSIVFNTALERFSFPGLEYVASLSITGNPSLVDVSLPRLSGADTVYIHYNEQLDGTALGASLAGVSASKLRIAPDQTQAELDPCPWTTDALCDENGLCAAGTDPVCWEF